MIEYKKHRLSRVITVQEIESADYVRGVRPSSHSHFHQEAWELCVCLEGETTVFCENKQYVLGSGQIFFVPPGKFHEVSVYQPDAAAFVVSFTCTNSDNLAPLRRIILLAQEDQLEFFRKMIRELELAFQREGKPLHLFQFSPADDSPLGAEQSICCYLELVILSLLRNITMDEGRVVRSDCFKEAIHTYLADQITLYIDAHLGEPITVESIARRFHYSRARLTTLYKQVTGLGIKEAIHHKRIKQAKILLAKKEKPVAQIADELGFSSATYFSHSFTKSVGMSPTQFAALSREADI